jgi:CheY-like chemotaxis protein
MDDRPVFIIDDDVDERDIIQDIFQELNVHNPLLFFDSGHAVLDYLQKDPTNPFLIICDVNLPQMDGFALRQRFADENSLHYKSIPFIFWSTTASNEQIKRAYDYGAHGFFFKGHNYAEIKQSLNVIIAYWTSSKAPVVT